jgi:hypothetical protein
MDKTFPRRLVSFLDNVQVNDMPSEEELTFLKATANKLVAKQNTKSDKKK